MKQKGTNELDEKQGQVETDLLYLLLREEDVARLNAQPSSYIIVPNDSISGGALIETISALIHSAVKVGIYWLVVANLAR
jgi:hypothetical protein